MAEGRDTWEAYGQLGPGYFRQWDFALIRAFNEHGSLDREFAASWASSRGACRFGRGAYGWPIAGRDNFALGRFLASVARDAELGCWADYESPPRAPLPSPGELQAYLEGIESVGVPAGFYSNLSELPRSGWLDARSYWFAGDHPERAGRSILIWQYGVVGGQDADRANDDALASFARRQSTAQPPKEADDVYLMETTKSVGQPAPQKLWKVEPSTVGIAIEIPGGQYLFLASMMGHKEACDELDVVREVQDALKLQGRPPLGASAPAPAPAPQTGGAL